MRIRRRLLWILGLCLSLLMFSGPATAAGTASSSTSDPVALVAEQAQKSIVGVLAFTRRSVAEGYYSKSVGSGFIINGGYVITNAHVVSGAAKLQLLFSDGTQTDLPTGVRPFIDANADVAVIPTTVGVRFPALTWGDSGALKAGQQVLAIGNPLGFRLKDSVTVGAVSTPSLRVPWNRFPVLLTDAAINPGNSGGPLVNMDGLVVGINTRKNVATGAEGLGYVLPSNQVQSIVKKLIAEGKVTYPWDGLYLSDTAESRYGLPDAEGIRVSGIYSGGPTATLDLKVGDIITHFNNVHITSLSSYYAELDKRAPGAKVVLKRKRGASVADVTFELVKAPEGSAYLKNGGIWYQMSDEEIDYASYVGQAFRGQQTGFETTWGYTKQITSGTAIGFLQTEFAFVAHHMKEQALRGGSVDYDAAALLAGVARGKLFYYSVLDERDTTETITLCQNGKCWTGEPGPTWPAPDGFLTQGRTNYRTMYVQFPSSELIVDQDITITLRDKNGAATGVIIYRLKNLW